MIKALWLTSWYPNRLDAMNGDFVQRHARAVALFCKVDVIHLEPDKKNVLINKVEITKHQNGNLSETILLYKLFSFPYISKLLSLQRYLKLFKVPVKRYIEKNGKPDIVHVHIPVKAGLIALWLKRKYNISYIVTEHWAIYNNKAEDAYPERSLIFKNLTKRILENAAMFLPVSKNLGDAVQLMVSPVPYTVIPNVADTNFFNYHPLKKEADNIFRFVHVSTLQYQKNPEGILKVYAKFSKKISSAELIVVGEHSERLLKYASILNIPAHNIKFTGLLSYESVADILKQRRY